MRWPHKTGRVLNAGANAAGGGPPNAPGPRSSKGMPPRADAGSNPANPSSDAIANGAIARL